LGPAIGYYTERTNIPKFYQVHLGNRYFERGKATLIPFVQFCDRLGMP
jgi:DNA-binding transcriptional MerR regulator